MTFNKGDIVQLKSGGPAMIVTGQSGSTVELLWYGESNDLIKTGSVPDFCLVEVEIEEDHAPAAIAPDPAPALDNSIAHD